MSPKSALRDPDVSNIDWTLVSSGMATLKPHLRMDGTIYSARLVFCAVFLLAVSPSSHPLECAETATSARNDVYYLLPGLSRCHTRL